MGGDKATVGTTLYDRLGGDSFMHCFTCSFFDEIVENEALRPFFKNISTAALKAHQVKLFRVIFGKEEDKPEEADLLDFMLRTHTRLFRELGLNETHFDKVAACFVQGLQTFQCDPALIDETVAILVPLRVVFEYGAQVAIKEKTMSPEEMKDLPKAHPKTFGTDAPVVLPEYSKIEIPDWLPEALQKNSNTGVVRAWTCDLTNRFGAEGDEAIADTFLDQPYMDHHVYLVALLQLAFMPDDVDPEVRGRAIEIVLFPRGPKSAPLSRDLFDKMISQFLVTCHVMGMSTSCVKIVEARLRSYRNTFASKTTLVGGLDAPHILQKNVRTRRRKGKKGKRRSKSQERSLLEGERETSSRTFTLLDFDDDGDNSSSSGFSAFSGCSSSSRTSASSRKKEKKRKSKAKKKLTSFFSRMMGSSNRSLEDKIPTTIPGP